MKKTLRFTSAALTLALAAGMALPAFAAAVQSGFGMEMDVQFSSDR